MAAFIKNYGLHWSNSTKQIQSVVTTSIYGVSTVWVNFYLNELSGINW